MRAFASFLNLFVLTCCTSTSQAIQFISQPVDGVASAGGSITLHCSLEGLPAHITWYRDSSPGVSLSNGAKYVMYSNGSMMITGFAGSDAGGYYCVATSSHGSVRSSTGMIVIAVIGSVSMRTDTLMVQRNTPLVLNCSVPSSTPPVKVDWYRGSSLVSLSSHVGTTLDHQLVFSYLTSFEQAHFTCKYRNELIDNSERESNSYFIQFQGDDTVANPVASLLNDTTVLTTIKAGMNTQIQCFATGRPVPTYTWTKDGASLTASQRITFLQNNRILSISNASLEDGGVYQCHVSQGSMKLNRNISLTIRDPPSIISSFDSVSQFASLSINISCTAKGDGQIKWLWRNNTQTISQSTNIHYTVTGLVSFLVIESLDVFSNVTLQCVAYTNDSLIAAASNNLYVQTMTPSFNVSPSDVFVFTGDKFVLSCFAVSYPYPTFYWQKNNVLFSYNNRYSLSTGVFNGTLTVLTAQRSDTGNYKCLVETLSGQFFATEPVVVRVIDPPTITSTLSNLVLPQGSTVKLPCSVSSIQDVDVTYSWTKDGRSIDTGSNRVMVFPNGTLFIQSFTAAVDAGMYECMAGLDPMGNNANSLSYVIGSAFISTVPPTPPSPPHSLTTINTTASSIHLSWAPPLNNGSLSILQYIIEIQSLGLVGGDCPVENDNISITVEDTSITSTVIESLTAFMKFKVVMYAVNSRGASNVSEEFEFTTKESIPSSPPQFVTVHETLLIGQLLVNWSHPPCQEREGIVTHYIIAYSSSSSSYHVVLPDNRTSFLITGLSLLTRYNISIAPATISGLGPYSLPVIGITSRASPPLSPNNLTYLINCTSVTISWTPPTPVTSEPINNLTIPSYYVITIRTVSPAHTMTTHNTTSINYTYNGVGPGVLGVSVAAVNAFGKSSPSKLNITILDCGTVTATPTSTPSGTVLFYEEVWFRYATGGAGGGVVFCILFLCCCCCLCCCVKKRKKVHNVDQSSSPRPRFHFTYPNRRSTVLDRMMNVQALPPDHSHQSIYAELGTATLPGTSNPTVTPPLPPPNGSIDNGMGTLSSQSSTLRYQYKSPLEKEAERGEMMNEEQESMDQMPEVIASSTRSRKSSTAQRRLFQSLPADNNQPRSLSLTKYKRSRFAGRGGESDRAGSTSPTDTVSSFEYESHAQINAKLAGTLQPQHFTNGSVYGEGREGGGGWNERGGRYDQRQLLPMQAIGPPPHSSYSTTGLNNDYYKQLPDLALMTSSLSIAPYSPALSETSRLSSSTAKGYINNDYQAPPLHNNNSKGYSNNQCEEDYYQTPRAARQAAMASKLSMINSQMSLV